MSVKKLLNMLLHITVVLLYVAHITKSELFTALADVENLLLVEQDIANDLREYIRSEEDRLDKIRTIADDYEKHSRESLQDVLHTVGHPVNAYLLVKRFTLDWENVESMLRNDSSQGIINKINERRDTQLPDNEDLSGAATALLRLQDTYEIPTSILALGELGKKKPSLMTASDCFELGKSAYNNGDHYHTILWMTESMDILETERNKTVDKSLLLDYLSYSLYQRDNVRYALALTDEWLQLAPDHERAQNNKKYYEELITKEESDLGRRGDLGESKLKNDRPRDDYKKSQEFVTYEALCRGEDTHPIPDAHKLKCSYTDNGHPWLKIQPIKQEIVFNKPLITIFHDVMSDREVEVVKSLAKPRLARSTVFHPAQKDPAGRSAAVQTYRTSKGAWLDNTDHPIIDRVDRRVHAVTHLHNETTEQLQVVNYGIGGHYEPHFDYARDNPGERHTFEENRGNRIATMLFYMSDVELGGATVFPTIGAKVFPKKGTAVFWHNLLQSGEGDELTRHAACPVLVGSKWVANKWIHERGQEFMRPCDLSADM